MAYYDYFNQKKPSRWKRFIWAITPDWWDDLWWEKNSFGNHDIVFGGEYRIVKTFKTGNLALIIAIGTLIAFIIYIS
jgi:hypothetical protein